MARPGPLIIELLNDSLMHLFRVWYLFVILFDAKNSPHLLLCSIINNISYIERMSKCGVFITPNNITNRYQTLNKCIRESLRSSIIRGPGRAIYS